MLTFLYHTPVGRCLLKALTKPALSKTVGRFLDSPASRFLIPVFIRQNRLVWIESVAIGMYRTMIFVSSAATMIWDFASHF